MRARVSRIVACTLVAAAMASSAAPPSRAGSISADQAGRRLRATQRSLIGPTVLIRVHTAAWLAMQPSVRGARQAIRRLTAAMRRVPKQSRRTSHALAAVRRRIRHEQRALERMLPAWRAINQTLTHAYRQIRATLRAEQRTTVRPMLGGAQSGALPAAWDRAWPAATADGSGRVGVCPVQGPVAFADTFGAPRPGGRIHEGIDLHAATGTPVVAVRPGVAVRVPNALGGRAVLVRSAGRTFTYDAHFSAYGAVGSVPTGTVIGYVGTSGDAKGLIPHVHFELHPEGGAAVDPFPLLQARC